MSKTANLPSWATAICPGKIEIDADSMYIELLTELQIPLEPATDEDSHAKSGIDQYWLSTALTCAKLDVQFAIAGTELQPPEGGALVIIVKDTTKGETPEGEEIPSTWAMASFPEGSGEKLALQGREARETYKNLRNLPI